MIREKEEESNITYTETEEKENEKKPSLESYNFLVREISTDISFESLMSNLENDYFTIPKNQRNYIWSKEQVQELAISLIKGFPIPPLYGYRNKDNQIVILDGQQRLISLYLYYKSKFFKNTSKQAINLKAILKEDKIENETAFERQLENTYGLKDVEYQLENKNGEKIDITYKNLPSKDKRAINRAIKVVEIMVQTEEDNKEDIYYKIFGNLNQGGTPLKNQELRNGIYQCDFYDMLHDINNNNEKWRNIYGTRHKNSRDMELLLRFAATEFCFELIDEKFDLEKKEEKKTKIIAGKIVKIPQYENSYPQLLNEFSKISLSFDKKIIENFKINIQKFIEKIELQPQTKIENLLLESLYLASVHIKGNYKITNDLIDKIKQNNIYKNCTRSSSSSRSNVEKRLNFVYQELKDWVGDKNEL